MTLVCFSHLRWDFVFQRPQHLMSLLSQAYPVIYWEEPVFESVETEPWIETYSPAVNLEVAIPHLPHGLSRDDGARALRELLDGRLQAGSTPLIAWYYTPMMLTFSRHLNVRCVVYDCMDELANFRFAPDQLASLETELLERANLVFTGGISLYEAKRERHSAVYAFPSSVDVDHFARARVCQGDPEDQADLARPRFGFYGVIDERMDLALLAAIAEARPEWSIVMVGPVVKIDPMDLPQRPNIAYLGSKNYGDLPAYAAGWDVALMPFAINEATQFISPTKTPEYLAAGLPVVTTPIADVIRRYSSLSGVTIGNTHDEFIAGCETALSQSREPEEALWRQESNAALEGQSWSCVADTMLKLIAPFVAAPSTSKRQRYDYLVVGAGFAGAVMAERLAQDGGKRVLLIDRRSHVGGNAYDCEDSAGIMVHKYGPHIFHTNSKEIVGYLSQFTGWRPYEHRVQADIDGLRVPMPINRTTLNQLFNLELKTDSDAAAFLAARAEPLSHVATSADVVISAIGRELYETFFQGYTRKQWGLDPSELDKSVTARVPTRTNTDDRYFTDAFQAMPDKGYTAMFERMLDHPLIDMRLGVEYREIAETINFDRLVFTGPIDEFFNYDYGKLPYRSLRFDHKTLDQELLQDVAVVNFPSERVAFTRITEYKHLTGQISDKTSITYEYPCSEGDPYYPIPRPENELLYKQYKAMADSRPDVLFVGRLATYRYYNMDQVVGQALATYRRQKIATLGDECVIPLEAAE